MLLPDFLKKIPLRIITYTYFSRSRAKYEHLIGKDAAKEGARSMEPGNRSFGMVSAESKKDRRTVEDIQKELRDKKKRQKLENEGEKV